MLLLIVKLSECLPLSDVFLIELLLQNTIFGFYLGVFFLLLSYLLELPLLLGLKFQVSVVKTVFVLTMCLWPGVLPTRQL